MRGRTLRQSIYLAVICAALGLLPGAADCAGQPPQTERRSLPTLTTAREAHNLTVEQAAQSYPVRLRAIITYYDPFNDVLRPACFASDSTGSIYVDLRFLPAVPFKVGDVLSITGKSAPGGYAPIVIATEANVIGISHFPWIAPRVTLDDIRSGTHDGQWVEVEGVVHEAHESRKNVALDLALNDGEIIATTTRQAGTDYPGLVDAQVRIHGNAAPLFNQLGQFTGAYLLFPDRAQVTIEEPAPAHPFGLPVSPVSSLLRFTPKAASRHRVHIRGTVTLIWPGRLLCIQDGLHGLCAQTDQTTPLTPGEVADVVGFPVVGAFAPTLTHAIYEAAPYRQPVPAIAVTAEQALRGNHDGELVELEGQLIGQDDFSSDPDIVLSSGGYVFSAVMPTSSKLRSPGWQKGATLKIVGICSVKGGTDKAGTPEGNFSIPESFRILLRSPLDVVVMKSPSWWTPTHTIVILGVAAMLTLLVLSWVFVLRNQVFEQTQTIRQQLFEQKRCNASLAQQAEELSWQGGEIRKLNDGLEERIAKRTAQLQSANGELEAFSYSVSHDLRTPLRHIAGFTRILVNDYGAGMTGEARECLQQIENGVRRMGQLVDALLSLARLGQQSLRLRHTELNIIVDGVISLLQPECEGRDVEWRVAKLPALDCDPILTGQVFQNLLGNALKYSRGRAHAVIEVDSIEQMGKPAVIFVRDNGAGFDMKYATKLFGVFQRMHTEAEFDGIGVGLATVDRIIQKHGGNLWAEAETNHGATFYFTMAGNDQTGTAATA